MKYGSFKRYHAQAGMSLCCPEEKSLSPLCLMVGCLSHADFQVVAMGFNEPDRSELERRFEALFSQVFQCPWHEYLKAQYSVQADGQTYFIDYVYESGSDRIGIELDGRGKFYQYKHVFNNFFQRQRAIQLSGITVYRFTWTDVVEEDGWRARKHLQQIFKDKLPTTIHALVPTNNQPPDSNLVEYQPWPPRQSRIEAPWQPTIRAMGLFGGLLALSLMIIWIAGLNNRHAPAPQEETKITQAVSEITQTQKSRIRTRQAGLKLNQARTVAVHTQMGRIRRIPKPPITSPVLAKPPKTAIPVEKVESLPPALSHSTPQELPKPALAVVDTAPPEVRPIPVLDEIVAFNQASRIFHKPNSYWARKCTRNCHYIPKSQAIQMGGRASQADY